MGFCLSVIKLLSVDEKDPATGDVKADSVPPKVGLLLLLIYGVLTSGS